MEIDDEQVVPTEDEIADRLLRDLGYKTERTARKVARDLLSLDGDLKAAFLSWWHTGELPAVDPVAGYTLEQIQGNIKIPGLLPFIAWLRTLPEKEAIEAINRGFDIHPLMEGQ